MGRFACVAAACLAGSLAACAVVDPVDSRYDTISRSLAKARNESKDVPPAPIVELVMRKPWLLANLYSGRIPQREEELCTKD